MLRFVCITSYIREHEKREWASNENVEDSRHVTNSYTTAEPSTDVLILTQLYVIGNDNITFASSNHNTSYNLYPLHQYLILFE